MYMGITDPWVSLEPQLAVDDSFTGQYLHINALPIKRERLPKLTYCPDGTTSHHGGLRLHLTRKP